MARYNLRYSKVFFDDCVAGQTEIIRPLTWAGRAKVRVGTGIKR